MYTMFTFAALVVLFVATMPVGRIANCAVGTVLASATVRFVDCAEAPKPSPTVRRKNSVAPATLNCGAVNVALRGVAATGVRVTFATAQLGAQGAPLLSVWTHWYVKPDTGSPSASFADAGTVSVTVVPTGRDAGVADGAPTVGARLALIWTVVNDGALSTSNVSVTTRRNRSVVDVATCGALNDALAVVAPASVTVGVIGSPLSSTCVHWYVSVSPLSMSLDAEPLSVTAVLANLLFWFAPALATGAWFSFSVIVTTSGSLSRPNGMSLTTRRK